MRLDATKEKERLKLSEEHRLDLQNNLVENAARLREDNLMHQDVQTRLAQDNERLRQELQDARALLARKEQEHLVRLDEVAKAHQLRTDALAQLHHDTITQANSTHHARQE